MKTNRLFRSTAIVTLLLLSPTSDVNAKEETISCTQDSDCTGLNDYFICVGPLDEEESGLPDTYAEGERPKECIHKPAVPLAPKEWVGTFVFSLIMCLSNVAGIGGGGVAIPLAMYFFNLSMKPAIAISSFSIMISTLARFFFNFNERHPEKKDCACIDYGMTNVMMPLTLLGSLIGAYFYVAFPDLILQITLTLLLLLLTGESGRKAKDMCAKETLKLQKEKEQKELEMKNAPEVAKDDNEAK